MGLLNKLKKTKKEEEEKKVDEKSTKVDNAKKGVSPASFREGSGLESVSRDAKKMYTEKKSDKDDKGVKNRGNEKKSRVLDSKNGNKKYGNAYRVLVKPLITEKASVLGAENKYFFEVSKKANKIEIAKAINDVYGVKPVKVNIIRMSGKNVRYGRVIGKRKGWKKAVVTLKEGDSIKIYEGV
jgi:large subunit ribosomal protein L23